MLILSRVCAEFHDETGAPLFTVTPSRRLTFVEAPEAIRGDPLFRLLVEDGSLEAAVHPDQQALRALEQDPLRHTDADGKKSGGASRRSPAPRRSPGKNPEALPAQTPDRSSGKNSEALPAGTPDRSSGSAPPET